MTDKPPSKPIVILVKPNAEPSAVERHVMGNLNKAFGKMGSRDTVLYPPDLSKAGMARNAELASIDFSNPGYVHGLMRQLNELEDADHQPLKPSAAPKWDCSAPVTFDVMREHQRRMADLLQQYRDKVRETEADIVLSAVELYGCDIRGLHQQIHPDRTIYLVNGKPLVEVHRPHLKRENLLTPKTRMENADTPGEWVMSYRLLFKPENQS